MKINVGFEVPDRYKMDIVMLCDNGEPEFDLVGHGSSSERVVWTGEVVLATNPRAKKLKNKKDFKHPIVEVAH